MIAHGEKKRCADVTHGCKQRDAVLFLPVTIYDKRRADMRRDQLFCRCNHPLAFVTDYEMRGANIRTAEGLQSVRQQWSTKHRQEGLEEMIIRCPEAPALASNQDDSCRNR